MNIEGAWNETHLKKKKNNNKNGNNKAALDSTKEIYT